MKKRILVNCLFFMMIFSAKAQFTRGFDSGTIDSYGWSVINLGDVNTWETAIPTSGTTHNGSKVARIAISSGSPIPLHDDYLITPQINVTSGVNDRLTFWARSLNSNFIESFEVKLSTTTAISASSFSTTILPSTQAPVAWTKILLNLTPYIGQSIYISFHTTSNRYELYLDEFVNDAMPACNVSAPIISSATSPNCTTGITSVTLTGLPASGTWTINRIGTSSAFSSGTGTSSTVDVPENGNYNFYVVDSNGCQSSNSSIFTSPKSHDIDINAPMTATYTDANSNGIVDAGDTLNYQIQVHNSGACPLSNTSVNGVVDAYNPNLNFSGNPIFNISTLNGNTTTIVTATYMITQNDINNGQVENTTMVNAHWPSNSTAYYPICITPLTSLSNESFAFVALKYSPNPVKNYLYISNATSIETIEITSVLGQKVFSKNINDLQDELDLTSFNKGVYFVRVISKGFEKTFKIIKE